MAPKAKAAAPLPPSGWTCAECEQENEASDAVCVACDEPRPAVAECEVGRFAGYHCALVLSCEEVPGKKLRVLTVDTGRAELKVVTSASNVAAGVRVVVAIVGALVPDGQGETVAVKKASVGGVVSEGMLCDASMLGWSGGGTGAAALLPGEFALGAPPPDKRPRLDGM